MKKKSDAYVLTHIETIDDQNYLVDDKNFVYSFDVNNPEFLGIKVNNTIKKLEYLMSNDDNICPTVTSISVC